MPRLCVPVSFVTLSPLLNHPSWCEPGRNGSRGHTEELLSQGPLIQGFQLLSPHHSAGSLTLSAAGQESQVRLTSLF